MNIFSILFVTMMAIVSAKSQFSAQVGYNWERYGGRGLCHIVYVISIEYTVLYYIIFKFILRKTMTDNFIDKTSQSFKFGF